MNNMKLESMKPGDKLYYKGQKKSKLVEIIEVNYRDGFVVASWDHDKPKRYERWQIEQLKSSL